MLIFLLAQISAVDTLALTLERQSRLDFEHLIYITDVQTEPADITPGSNFFLSFKITNKGTQFARDIVSRVTLPNEMSTYKDIGTHKLLQLNPGESSNVNFSLIVSPDAAEGLYKIPILVEYVNYIGDDRQENETLTAIVASVPKLFAEVKTSEIYKGQDTGKITVTIANNDLANVKFLTLELKPSDNYDIINSRRIYVGDLDSDDSQGTDFRIRVNNNLDEIPINIILIYKDAINRDYTQELSPILHISTSKELGLKSSNTGIILVILIILGAIGYWYYRKHKKNKVKKAMLI